jgi:hypothetical protein
MSNESEQTNMTPMEKAVENEEGERTKMDPVEKATEELGHKEFIRPVFEPANINDITLSDGVRTDDIHVLDDRGATSIGVAILLDIIAWAKNMNDRTAMLERQAAQQTEQATHHTARTAMLERHHAIAIKCPVCLVDGKTRVLHCGHRFCGYRDGYRGGYPVSALPRAFCGWSGST